MRHLDLFSGIGGFALATEMAFPNEEVEHIFCDNEPFSQAILKKHWPNSYIHNDIKTLTNTRCEYGRTGCSEATQGIPCQWCRSAEEIERFGRVDLLTGGFPCQPFSAAGRRAGTEDSRHLWPEMLRVIRETNPTFVLGENVGGLLTWDGGLVLEMVITDLEAAGYEAGAFVIPACAVGAPHRRDRVWIAAHAIGSDAGGASRQLRSTQESERLSEWDEVGQPSKSDSFQDDTNAIGTGLEGKPEDETEGQRGLAHRAWRDERFNWKDNWPEVAAELCTLDDGLPNGLARPRGWRNAALKGAGNAIVPQVAAEVLKAMFKA